MTIWNWGHLVTNEEFWDISIMPSKILKVKQRSSFVITRSRYVNSIYSVIIKSWWSWTNQCQVCWLESFDYIYQRNRLIRSIKWRQSATYPIERIARDRGKKPASCHSICALTRTKSVYYNTPTYYLKTVPAVKVKKKM